MVYGLLNVFKIFQKIKFPKWLLILIKGCGSFHPLRDIDPIPSATTSLQKDFDLKKKESDDFKEWIDRSTDGQTKPAANFCWKIKFKIFLKTVFNTKE